MNAFKTLLAFFGLATGFAVAQVPDTDATYRRHDVAALLNLDEARAVRVRAVIDGAHEKVRVAREQIGAAVDETTRLTLHAAMEAIRSDTEEKLSAILTEDEMLKLHAVAPAPAGRLEAMHFKRI
jgi:hypothetical protein